VLFRSKRAGASIVEVPIRFVDRQVGQSKMSSAIVVEALILVTWWALRRAVGGTLRLASGRRRAERARVPVPPG
jgi:dolichol-phosphate mannosyltransferase